MLPMCLSIAGWEAATRFATVDIAAARQVPEDHELEEDQASAVIVESGVAKMKQDRSQTEEVPFDESRSSWPLPRASLEPAWECCDVESVASSWLEVADVDELDDWHDAGEAAPPDDGDSSCASFLVVSARPTSSVWSSCQKADDSAKPQKSWAALAAAGPTRPVAPRPGTRVPPLTARPTRIRTSTKAADLDELDSGLTLLEQRRLTHRQRRR
jgi:hypothetical protein